MRSRRELANALRILAVDAIERAKSGHPGACMGMADMAEALWRGPFRHNPANPAWADRDRFILSNGHASMLQYALLHLTGYALTMDALRDFRQLGSLTPGHPEYGLTPGVDMTTGPLGQGLASAVGMALAERVLAETFNRPGLPIVDHHTYVFLGDGCLMEGVSHEACSLAGTLALGKLIAMYDSNGISIDGRVEGWFTDNTPERFAACGWQVIRDIDGHDADALDAALALARSDASRPSLICCRTIIAYGSPGKSGSNASHGAPLGAGEALAVRRCLGWESPPFVIPADIREAWDARARGARDEEAWNRLFAGYMAAWPEQAEAFERRMNAVLPERWDAGLAALTREMLADSKPMATRKAGNQVLELLAQTLPELFGGAADLSESVGVRTSRSRVVTGADMRGNALHYGVREFAMSCLMNGMALHGGFLPYGGTFLVFSDYMRAGMRLGAIMGLHTIYILSHDSVGVGEDGPTHQPVEHVPSLRLMPGMTVWRPADGMETCVAWKDAIQNSAPTVLVFSRQNLPALAHPPSHVGEAEKGGYVLFDCRGTPEAIVIATGSEVHCAFEAVRRLQAAGRAVRLVSMPCTQRFDAQSDAWREHVLPAAVRARVAVEAASPDGWHKYVGTHGRIVGMNGFGLSAPGEMLFEHFGFSAEAIVAAIAACLA